ncbi:MAG: NADH-quinone oxidoreductase subunit C [Acidimicrobiia bacterium]|nr:NADH-quinone oxidoreductase subunit C [Acidimicrobiia bacterium]
MSPSETDEAVAEEGAADGGAADPLSDFANEVADAVGGTGTVTFGTVKVSVPLNRWAEAIRGARDRFDLVFFSWLSAIHWSNDVAVGDPPDDEVDERYELLCTVADLTQGRRVTFSTDVPTDDPHAPTLTGVFPGADWHEREAHDMFGIRFDGHPGLEPIYLPENFIGHPLRKSYPLLSREVKPWPGKVDVEAMPETDDDGGDDDGPSTENPEA